MEHSDEYALPELFDLGVLRSKAARTTARKVVVRIQRLLYPRHTDNLNDH